MTIKRTNGKRLRISNTIQPENNNATSLRKKDGKERGQ